MKYWKINYQWKYMAEGCKHRKELKCGNYNDTVHNCCMQNCKMEYMSEYNQGDLMMSTHEWYKDKYDGKWYLSCRKSGSRFPMPNYFTRESDKDMVPFCMMCGENLMCKHENWTVMHYNQTSLFVYKTVKVCLDCWSILEI